LPRTTEVEKLSTACEPIRSAAGRQSRYFGGDFARITAKVRP
jgi:hypothetical protein